MKIEPLTKKEQEIMDVLWNNSKEMSANDIKNAAPELNSCTIQQVIQKLLKKGIIEIAGIGYTKNALTRTYSPTLNQATYLGKLANEVGSLQFVTNYIEDSNDIETLNSLEEIIKEKLKGIKD